jgi:hypothetical protein
MQIPGLLVEYLINGAFALTWLLPVITSFGLIPDTDKIPIEVILLLVPGLYVLGMIVDTAAELLIRSRKKRIKESVYQTPNISKEELKRRLRTNLNVKLVLYAPELAKTVQIRSSIDRVARSSFLNIVLLTVVVTFKGFQITNGLVIPILLLVMGGMLSFLCFKMWSRFQFISYDYQMAAYQVLEEKLNEEKMRRKKLSDEADTIQRKANED